MKKIAFFDTKPYDKESFERQNNGRYDIRYFETRLTEAALPLADGCDAACAFVNAEIDRAVVEGLAARGIKVLAYDAFPNPATGLEDVTLDRLLAKSMSSRCIVRFFPKRSTSSTPTRSPRQSAASRSSTPRAADLSIRRRCSLHCAMARSARPGWTCMKRKANGSTKIVRT